MSAFLNKPQLFLKNLFKINPVRLLTTEVNNDEPILIENPFEKPKEQCILCKHNIKPDFKNVRLLSQFVSPYTGRIYGRHITALCEKKQKDVEMEISKSRRAGFMAGYLKDPIFFKDPKLYDPENPIRPHKY